jgi:hypothetical protein
MKLNKNDIVITAYAESCNGPGWANSPIWIIVQDETNKLRKECLQPEEQTKEMRLLYKISEQAHLQMSGLVDNIKRKSA